MTKTRVKICGLTQKSDITAAVRSGADALGFVFYENSPRFLSMEKAQALLSHVPPFVQTIGLFVNPSQNTVLDYAKHVPFQMIQFHGDESSEFCDMVSKSVAKPYIKALRIANKMTEQDVRAIGLSYPHAQGLLLDAWSAAFGGSGKQFNWQIIPSEWLREDHQRPNIILSGGLNQQNVLEAISQVNPFAVDVSSGVEDHPGIKNPEKIAVFIDLVKNRQHQTKQTS